MDRKLFIIGNGFDIQHGIPSKYQDFHAFIQRNYSLHRDLAYIPGGGLVPKQYMNGFQSFDIEYVLAYLDYTISLTEKTDYWWNIEDSLSKLHLIEEFDVNSDDPFTKVSYNDKPENTIYYIGQCFRTLYALFHIWVNKIDLNGVSAIPSFRELFDPINDYFLSFNYTKTLEDIYLAKNVFHIHGTQGSGSKAFGHQYVDDEYIADYCNRNLIPQSCFEGTKYLFEMTEKDTRAIYENNREYFDSLPQDISEIYSYGFSFSAVDMIYIFAICNSLQTKGTTWFLSDFSSFKQIEDYKSKIQASGFRGSFSTFHIQNSLSNTKPKKNSFTRYFKKILYSLQSKK